MADGVPLALHFTVSMVTSHLFISLFQRDHSLNTLAWGSGSPSQEPGVWNRGTGFNQCKKAEST